MRRLLPVIALLTLAATTAPADEFSTSFENNVIDPANFTISQPNGFDVVVSDGKVVLTKLEGTGNGFVNVSTAFTIKGDFEVTVTVDRTSSTSGSAIGLVTSHISAAGFSDIYFNSTGNLVSNIFIDPVHAQQVSSAPAPSLILRVRREGNHLIHDYDAGAGFVGFNESTNDVLAGPVQVGFFLGEEGGQTALSAGTFDDFAVEGDVFTPPCGNGVLETGEACDDDSPDWTAGDFCNSQCEVLACGDADDSGTISVVDALHTLRTSVGTKACDDCICDVDSSGGAAATSVSDALRILRKSVGQPVDLTCPACA